MSIPDSVAIALGLFGLFTMVAMLQPWRGR